MSSVPASTHAWQSEGLAAAFSPSVWWEGMRISAQEDRVRVVAQRVEETSASLFASVEEDGRRFDVSLTLRLPDVVEGRCSCGEGRHCRHAAAVAARFLGSQDLEEAPLEAAHPEVVVPDDWYSEFGEASDAGGPESDFGWFEFECGALVDGERVNLLPVILEHVVERGKRPDELPAAGTVPVHVGGRVIAFPVERLRGILDVLTELYEPGELASTNRLRVHPARVSQFRGQVRSLARAGGWGMRLPKAEAVEEERAFADVPEGFVGELRAYQREGVAWLQRLRADSTAGILADDMGLGKTVQTLCHLLCEKASGRADRPSLIVAPKSVVGNWKREAEKFTPGMRVLILEGSRRRRYYGVLDSCDLLLTTYPVVSRDIDLLAQQPFHCVVLDEAQTIKNPRSLTAKAACRLKARHRVCLSGTPLENHLGELWSQFHFLMPGFLGSCEAFSRKYRKPIEKDNDMSRLAALQARVAPYLLRRTKDLVTTELPPKTEIIQSVELGAGQADLYEAVRASVNEEIVDEIAARGLDGSRMVILTAIMKLRQLCCDPRLLQLKGEAARCGSAKLTWLIEMLGELVAEDRRVIVFSQFTSMLALIAEQLEEQRLPYLTLTGASRDRMQLVDRFQSGGAPIFLISLKAGATGLNLTAADTVIHYDPWWNPAVESQATDRAYRIGQTRPVFVYKLVSAGTIEEKMLGLQRRKAIMTKAVLGRNSGALDLNEAQIDELLAPIGR